MDVNLHKDKTYKLQELKQFNGSGCTIYTVGVKSLNALLFHKFEDENLTENRQEVLDIAATLRSISKHGAPLTAFKFGQGKPGDKTCYLYCEPQDLRLYCIRVTEEILIIGTGGKKDVRTWQEDETLEDAMHWMMQVSEDVHERIKKDQIKISADGRKLEGNLIFKKDD